MAKQVFLNGLQIKGFRPFAQLNLPRLARVNLIVGKNGVGKSSLLEAIQLLIAEGAVSKIRDILTARNEISIERGGDPTSERAPTQALAYEALFFGRPDLDMNFPEFSISSLGDNGANLHVSYCRFITEIDLEDVEVPPVHRVLTKDDTEGDSSPALKIKFGDRERLIDLDAIGRRLRSVVDRPLPFHHVPASGLSANEIAHIWDRIALREEESIVYDALRLISGDIERVVFVADPRERYRRYAMVKVQGGREPVPLFSLGEGINHLFGITVSLVAARNGLLLIDEIENGLHYSLLERFWSLILDQSQALNVQVFAATHSLDCIRGFQDATTGLEASDALLIRLQGTDGNIEGVTFNPDELRIVTEEDIEVR